MDKKKDIDNSNINMTSLIDNTFLQLVDINLENIEFGIDCFLEENTFIKEIPIIGVITSITETGINIQNKIFINKLFKFIKSVNEGIATDKEKDKYLIKIKNKKYRQKIGSTIFSFLNNFNELEKANLLGKLFANYVLGNYSYEIFIEFSNVVENIIISDLKLLDYLYENKDCKYYLMGNLNTGNFEKDNKLLYFSSAKRLINLNMIDSKDSIPYDQIENPDDTMSKEGYFQLGGYDLAIKINGLGILFFQNII